MIISSLMSLSLSLSLFRVCSKTCQDRQELDTLSVVLTPSVFEIVTRTRSSSAHSVRRGTPFDAVLLMLASEPATCKHVVVRPSLLRTRYPQLPFEVFVTPRTSSGFPAGGRWRAGGGYPSGYRGVHVPRAGETYVPRAHIIKSIAAESCRRRMPCTARFPPGSPQELDRRDGGGQLIRACCAARI